MIEICLIVPCYNEESRLDTNAFETFIDKNPNIHICFVNDESSDKTLSILQQLCTKIPTNTHILNLESNSGKAEAIRRGMLKMLDQKNNNFEYIGFWDADLATPLDDVLNFIKIATDRNLSLIFGSRILRIGGNIKRKRMRHFLGRVFATLASTLLQIPVYDTQCGAKLFKRDVIAQIFEKQFISYWIFDVEIFFRLSLLFSSKKVFLDSLYEYPLSKWTDVSGSKIKLSDYLHVPHELVRIFFKYRK